MASVESSIGPFNFISLNCIEGPNCPPPAPGEQLSLIQRTGVDGTAFVLTGKRGNPFMMRSFTTAVSKAEGLTAETAYKALIGAGTFPITWGGEVIAPHEYEVIDVRVIRVQTVQTASTSAGAICEAIWTLCPVEV